MAEAVIVQAVRQSEGAYRWRGGDDAMRGAPAHMRYDMMLIFFIPFCRRCSQRNVWRTHERV